MIQIKNKQAISKMEMAGKLLESIMRDVASQVKPGVTTADIDLFIEHKINQLGMISKMKGYKGYKHVSCISLNDVVVHGIPAKEHVLKNGDLVKIDVCASWQGYCADMARCFFVGDVAPEVKKLVEVTERCVKLGSEMARPGNKLSDISAAIQQEAERHGLGVVRDFAGHGIGKKMHEEPEVLNYGKPGNGPVLRAGMALAIEPMITLGKYEVRVAGDGWTVKTVDHSYAAHVEDTVVITENGPLVTTRSMVHNN